MFNDLLSKYAKLSVVKGINVQKDELLIINSPIECSAFARLIAQEAYKAGASDVKINYSDEKFTRMRFENSSTETLSFVPQFEIDKYDYYVEKGASFLSISASNPDILKGIDTNKISAQRKSRSIALRNYFDACSANQNKWCIVSVPTDDWASKVFTGIPSDEAVEKLWDAIFSVMRIKEDDPIAAWNNHTALLEKKVKELNDHNFDYLHITNSLGTDLKVKLAVDHIWCGGEDLSKDKVKFIANMPTEEIYTTPKLDGVDGIVFSSKPLNYCGNIIDNFSLTFKDGEVINYDAACGKDLLKSLLETDSSSKRLGEIALVPYDSPISNSNLIFYNTLYDENASCHLALGSSYPSCIKNGEEMSTEERMACGANDSLIHVDFMIGTKDTNITGVKKDGTEMPLFINGNWA